MAQPIVLPPAIPQPLKSAQGINPMLRSMQQPLPVRVSPNVNPRSAASWQRAPVGATFNGIGANSVADAVRMQKDSYLASGDGYPITGPNYVQQIRKDAAGQLYIAPPRMPTAGYAAVLYNRPNVKMNVGTALQGAPFRGGTIPPWVKGSKYYIPESPAAHRKAQMATLMGFGGFGALSDTVSKLSLKNDVSSADVVTAPDAKEDDTDNLFGGGQIVGQNHDDPNELVNTRKIKVIRVVKAYKEATGKDPDLAAIKFYAKTHLIPDIAFWRFVPNGLIPPNGSAKEILDDGGTLNDRNPYDPLVVFIQYAEGKRGNQTIGAFEGGKWTSQTAKSVEDNLGSALEEFDKKVQSLIGGSGGDTGGGRTGGGGGGGTGGDTSNNNQNAAAQSTDYTPVLIGAAVVATLFLAYKASQKA